MPELVAQSVANPEFPRVLEIAKLSETAPFAFDIAPDEAERAALARLLDAQAVRKLRFAGSLSPVDGGAGCWRPNWARPSCRPASSASSR